MRLIHRKKQNGNETISVGEYLREGHVERSITFKIENGRLDRVFFVSNEFGTVDWESGIGLTQAHCWESESQAQGSSALNRHFTTILENGAMPTSYAYEAILRDVLFEAPYEFAQMIRRVVKQKEWSATAELIETIDEFFAGTTA